MATALLVAFVAGFLARMIGLPALVGYLVAGFGLHAAGFEPDATLALVADLGILVLLFGIGLKLRIRTLTRPMVWATEVVFATIGTAVVTATLLVLGSLGMTLAADLSFEGAATVGLALSFSSTFFAVQTLDKRGERGSVQGRVAISILVLQDLLAVGYLVIADGSIPSPWAIPLVAGLFVVSSSSVWGESAPAPTSASRNDWGRAWSASTAPTAQTALGRRVVRGDALDRDFWERIRFHPDVELVVAAMSSNQANLECVFRAKEFLPHTRVASIATHADQVERLRVAGVDVARNLYEEAGQGLADDAITMVEG
jgi:hypothetical protein